MASFFYDNAADAFWRGDVEYLTQNVQVLLVDTLNYTPNQATDEFLSDIPAIARVANSGNLANKTVGVVAPRTSDADDIVLANVTGAPVSAVVLYISTGVDSTSRLLTFNDNFTPVNPNGENITVRFNPLGIARL